jgi:hypothetical protein
MPFPVKHLIEGHDSLVCVKKEDLVTRALGQMIEHDYSQLPIIDEEDQPLGMVTYEGILRGVRNFKTRLEELHVRDVMTHAPIYNLEDDLFDLLDQLKLTNAVLIVDPGYLLTGIVTSYDATVYFRERTEDLMRVEDIEAGIKDFIRCAYCDDRGEVNMDMLAEAIAKASAPVRIPDAKPKLFDDLSLGEYINLLFYKDTWKALEPIFCISKNSLHELLDGIRITRNALAHFHGEISVEQQDQLRFCAGWLARCQEDFQKERKRTRFEKLLAKVKPLNVNSLIEDEVQNEVDQSDQAHTTADLADTILIEQSSIKDSRYSPLADWLQSQPGKVDQVQLKFEEIEKIIGGELPPSAHSYRAWWSNDSVVHSQSKQWLDAGWRVSSINITEGRITFSRMRDREKAYIDYFSQLLKELTPKVDFPTKNASPEGANWIVFSVLPGKGAQMALFVFSFTRDRRYRIELYLDLYDQAKTKQVFDRLLSEKIEIEKELGPLSWERLDNRRASRLAIYRPGQIMDGPRDLAGLRKWSVETMPKFYKTLASRIEMAIQEAMKS